MNMDVYFDRESGLYYFDGDPKCSNCGSEILEESGKYIVWHPKREKSFGSLWCLDCFSHGKAHFPKALYACELFDVFFGDRPSTAFLIPIQRMRLCTSDELTTFDVAVSNKGLRSDVSSTTIKDNTRLAGRESWEGVAIGADVPCDSRVLGVDEAAEFLGSFKDSVPIVNEEKKRLM